MAIAASNLVPFVGGTLAEVIEHVWVDPFRRRVEEFLIETAAALRRHEEAIARLDGGPSQEQIVSVALRAAQAAAATHETRKREMLRNAVVNMALGVEPDDVWPMVLIELLDTLTEAHLVALQFLNDPVAGLRARGLREQQPGRTREDMIESILGVDRDLVAKILYDLDRHQLAHNVGSLMTPGHGTSDLGKRLLRFVTATEDTVGSNGM